MALPAKAQWKAASDSEVASLKRNNVYTLLPGFSVPSGHKIIGSRWGFRIKADDSKKGRVIVPSKCLGVTVEGRSLQFSGFKAFTWCWQ